MATAVKDPLVGRLVDGRYLVSDRIASGGMATVYLATDTRLERPVALKVMHAHLAADASFVARFTREARSAARLSHPGVVSVYDQGAGDGTVYLAMEHVPGRTLRDLVAEAAPLALGEALAIIEEVLDGLAAAHAAGLVHRDVKPENVLVGDDGRLRVADFGLARAATTATGGATSTLIGTVGYLAPELVLEGASDERADVYAAGVVLYELLTGRAPFAGGAAAQVAYRHVSEDLPRVSSVRPGVPEGVDALVASSTDRDPARRPRDAGVMLEQVRSLHDALPDAVLDAPAVVLPDPSTVPVTRDGTRVQAREHIVALPVAELRDAAVAAGVVDGDDGSPTTTAAMPAVSATSTPTRADRRGPSVLGLPVDADDEPAATRADRPRRRPRRGALVLVCSLLAVLIAGGAAAVWAFTAGPLARVAVPDVTPGTQAQAVSAVEGQDLVVALSQAYSDTVPEGSVISTSPDAGDRVEKQSTVTVVVSQGPQYVTVPALGVGDTRAEAEAAITGAGLTVGDVVEGFSDTVPVGAVVSQQTPAGQGVPADTPVSFTTSKGPAPIDLQPLEGLSLDEAEKAITDAGLIRGRVNTAFSDTVAKDAVISATLPQGALEKGDVIDLVVSDGPSEVTVPGVGGRTLDEARGAVEALGLSVREERPLGFGDRVYQQYPSPGEVVEPGTTVVLTLGP